MFGGLQVAAGLYSPRNSRQLTLGPLLRHSRDNERASPNLESTIQTFSKESHRGKSSTCKGDSKNITTASINVRIDIREERPGRAERSLRSHGDARETPSECTEIRLHGDWMSRMI